MPKVSPRAKAKARTAIVRVRFPDRALQDSRGRKSRTTSHTSATAAGNTGARQRSVARRKAKAGAKRASVVRRRCRGCSGPRGFGLCVVEDIWEASGRKQARTSQRTSRHGWWASISSICGPSVSVQSRESTLGMSSPGETPAKPCTVAKPEDANHPGSQAQARPETSTPEACASCMSE